jgi:hypothetical protein
LIESAISELGGGSVLMIACCGETSRRLDV